MTLATSALAPHGETLLHAQSRVLPVNLFIYCEVVLCDNGPVGTLGHVHTVQCMLGTPQ